MKSIKNALKRCAVSFETGLKKYDISVVVPIYNTGRYLPECIESILAQTKDRIQIILVDDGSTDNSEDIGRRYKKAYSNITYIKKENSGVGATRNTGARLATGKYLAFVDSDDKIDPCMLERLFALAEEHHCDVATCGMLHFSDLNGEPYPSPLYDNAFKHQPISINTLEGMPELLYNTSACNKLILRSTFEKSGLYFPEGMVYEDLLSSIKTLNSATRIAATPEKLYFYRTRAAEGESITQQRHKLQNLLDRITAAETTLDYLDSHASRELKHAFQLRFLDHDLKLHFRSLPDMSSDDQEKAMATIARYADKRINQDILEQCSDLARIKIELAKNNDLSLLLELIKYENTDHKKAPIHQHHGKLFTLAPSFLEDYLGKTGHGKTIDVTRDVLWKEPRTSVEHVETTDDSFVVWGCIYQNRVSLAAGDQCYKAALVDESGRKIVDLAISPVQPRRILKSHTIMRNLQDQESYDYSGCGFKVELPSPLSRFFDENQSLLVRIDIENAFFSGSYYLRKPDSVVKALESTYSITANEGEIALTFSESGYLRVAKRPRNVASVEMTQNNHETSFVSKKTFGANMAEEPQVSVVMPIHGSDYDLPAALESIASQTLPRLQVILVDDGTTWDGGRLAQFLASKQPNFEYRHKQPGTLGEACNFGAQFATSDFIAFASPYDTMDSSAYENLLDAALSHSAQIVAGDFDHIYDLGKTKTCNFAQLSFDTATKSTDEFNAARVVYDTLPWNHLFKREFYESSRLEWPSDATFNDARLMMHAYAAASSTHYLRKTVWHWRRRNRDDLSISRDAEQVAALEKKLVRLSKEDQEFRRLFDESELQVEHDFRRLDIDLRSDPLQITSAKEAERAKASKLIWDYLSTLSGASFAKLRVLERMKYHLICNQDYDRFVKLRAYELSDYKLLAVEHEEKRFVGRFPSPFATDENLTMDEELKRAIKTNVNKVEVNEGFTVQGQIYPYRVSVENREDLLLSVQLVSIDGDTRAEVGSSIQESKKGTRTLSSKNGGRIILDQPYRNYTVLIPETTLQVLPQGTYRLVATYAFQGLECEPINLGKPQKSMDVKPRSLRLASGNVATLDFGLRSELTICLK